MRLLFLILILSAMTDASAQLIAFEKDPNKNTTATYSEVVEFYEQLDKKYDQLKLITCGLTDVGQPLHLAILSKNKIFDPLEARRQQKVILLINNGIHPGEPEGIDASMMMVRNLLEKDRLPENIVICLVPVYNIDGQMNRGISRINQNGPEAYGFRGNYQNLDLNRDFIKSDSKNSQSFQEIFNAWKPEIFVDNHTSNGADYQYVMTLIPTQKDKLNPILSEYLIGTLLPFLYDKMETSGFTMTPYVNSIEETPDQGIVGFLETPRYTTGYAALHNTIGFMPETHMLKSYQQRVESTYKLMEHFVEIVNRDAKVIRQNKINADNGVKTQANFALSWKLNKEDYTLRSFKGYEAKYTKSEVSGLDRLYYDRNSPFQRNIKVWNNYAPDVSVAKPIAYVIPQAWQKVIDLLRLNGVQLRRLKFDTELSAEMYYIKSYKTTEKPFEGHYLHSDVQVKLVKEEIKFLSGDYVAYVNQSHNRYIVETLEPQGIDSFFAWNFFDAILTQKEHFSAYVFEDEAAKILKERPDLKQKLEELKRQDQEFAKNAFAQLDWVYKNSLYYEKTHMRYPVGRLTSDRKLDLK